MQRVWTCACGWRSTAENVDLRIRRGEAPKACRRCGGTTLTVSSEHHPQVTRVCKNQACRADFLGWVNAKYCAKCQPSERANKAWQGRRKYVWTPERDQILLDEYRNNPSALAPRFGWPKWVVVKRAMQLGLCRVKEKPWTKAEDAFLLEWVGTRTAQWMARQLRNRTETAVVVRLKRLNVSRRIQDGLTMAQLEQALGVDHRMIAGWVRSGRLPAERLESERTPQQGGLRYIFREEEISKFILANPMCFRLDRVDQAWFMGLMREAAQSAASAPATPAPDRDDVAAMAVKRAKRVTRKEARPSASELMPCVGVDEDAPCPYSKSVVARRGVPSRCPDCTLELRRRLRHEELERLKRIRQSAPPPVPEEPIETTL